MLNEYTEKRVALQAHHQTKMLALVTNLLTLPAQHISTVPALIESQRALINRCGSGDGGKLEHRLAQIAVSLFVVLIRLTNSIKGILPTSRANLRSCLSGMVGC